MKIVDIFNTSYFTNNWIVDISYFLDALLDGSDIVHYNDSLQKMKAASDRTIDMAGARLSADVTTVILGNYFEKDGITFIDSEDSNRNKLFEENYRRRNVNFEVVPLIDVRKDTNITEYVKSLDKQLIYSIDGSLFDNYSGNKESLKEVNVALAILISLYNPEVQIHLGSCCTDVFNVIMFNLDTEENKWLDYRCNVGNTFIEATTLPNGMLSVEGYGVYKWEQFKNDFLFIPKKLGEEKIKDPTSEGFLDVTVTALKLFKNALASKATLLEYFGV